jgi:hypothetical protein
LIEAQRADDPRIDEIMRRIRSETGLKFELESSHMQLTSADAGRATPEQALVTALAWSELVESVTKKTLSSLRLEDETLLKNRWEASSLHQERFETGRPPPRVDFGREARRWAKQEFPEYSAELTKLRDGFCWKKIAPEVLAGFHMDKKAGPFGREFSLSIAAGLTSKRFAPLPDRPLALTVPLFRLFRIGGASLRWTYSTKEDLAAAFESAARLMRPVLALFEAEAVHLGEAHSLALEAFSGPRHLSALEAHGIAGATARDWAADASLIRISSYPIAQALSSVEIPTPPASSGRLSPGGGWSLRYHSRARQRNLDIMVPCFGSPSQSSMDAATGHQWPSEADGILEPGWMDSTEAARSALEALRQTSPEWSAEDLKLLALASAATGPKTETLPSPLRDGMFDMEARWGASFGRSGPDGKRSAFVRVPAYGGQPSVETFGAQSPAVPQAP